MSLVPHKPPAATVATWVSAGMKHVRGVRLGCGGPGAWGCEGLGAQRQAPCPRSPPPAPPGAGLLAAHSHSTGKPGPPEPGPGVGLKLDTVSSVSVLLW